ncbi:MAG: acyl-CoA synthetase [Acidimicrobiales bacterium]
MSGVAVWRITPSESEHQQRRVAGALRAKGIGRGDRVALAVPNAPEVLSVVLGASRTGVVPVMLNASLLPAEIDALVTDCEPSLVLRTLPEVTALVHGAGTEADLSPVPLCRPMHYTSGTSGTPKGVWPGVLDEASAYALHDDEAAAYGLGPEDTHLTCSPLYHSVAIRFSAQALLRGADVILLERFDAPTVARAIGEEGVRSVFMVPTHLHRLLALPDQPDLRDIRLLAHAGAACPAKLKRRLFERFPAGTVWEFYGASEGQFTICPPDEWLAHPGTVGRARAGRRLEIDEQGHIWCHVPEYARWSYWNDPAKTAAAWDGDAFTVHDLGRLDDDGYLFLDGRRDDLIISGGVNVYPAEVEQALLEVPGVDEVAVFGVPDEQWGQRVCAAFVGSASPTTIHEHARAVLAGYKRPKQIIEVTDLPRTGTGKVRRAYVAEWLGLERGPDSEVYPPQR